MQTTPQIKSSHVNYKQAQKVTVRAQRQDLRPFKLERFFDKYEYAVSYLMCPSDCEPLKLSELIEMADSETSKLWNDLTLRYSEAKGMALLREEICKMYNTDLDLENEVLVLAPQEGIYLAMNATLQQNDIVVTTYPGYQSLYEIGRSLGCQLRYWRPQKQESKWQFNVEDVEQLLEGAKMLVFNFPHNPTGSLLSHSEFQRLINICKERDIIVFSDEMYRGLEHDDRNGESGKQLPSAVEVYDNSITLSGVSKTLSMPGLRIGWLLCKNFKLFQKIQHLKDYTTICSSAPSEVLTIIGLRNRDAIEQRNKNLILQNKQLIANFLQSRQDIFQNFEADGGSIIFPRFKTSGRNGSVDRILNKAVEEAGVLLLPGSLMTDGDIEGDQEFLSHFRVGLGRSNFHVCLDQFQKFVDQNSDEIMQLLKSDQLLV
eukprot:TRINITY_DN7372_c0_g1_i4.p1 TRINITY_DN7372_c0_g1~~TRINITY_DN7372_c0_g1_i4.p1  ORF type:complete len:442 (-),score=33.85 TRINITY_DN7372_c0_g1_i4:106-1395(-)